MADTQMPPGTAEAGSFKDKLLQPSERDELSTPDQQASNIKLPPSKDAGSPPMTVSITEAPAGADDSGTTPAFTTGGGVSGVDAKTGSDSAVQEQSSKGDESSSTVTQPPVPSSPPADDDHNNPGRLWSPGGNTQSPVDGRHKFMRSVSGAKGSVREDYELPQGRDAAAVVPQPQHVDDHPEQEDEDDDVGNTGAGTAGVVSTAAAGLSDVYAQVISDPSTDDLVAAATGDLAAAAAVNDEPAAADMATVNADEALDVQGTQADSSAVLPGPDSQADTTLMTKEDDTAAAAGSGGSGVSKDDAAASKGDTTTPAAAAADITAARTGEITDISGEGEARETVPAAAAADDHDSAACNSAAAAGDSGGVKDSSSKKEQNPLAAATTAAAAAAKPMAAAVTKPVAAAVSQLKGLVIGSGDDVKSEGLDQGGNEMSELVKEAEKDAVEIEGGEKLPAFAVL